MKTVFCFFLLFYFYRCVENSDELGREEVNVKEEISDGIYKYQDNLEGKDHHREFIIRPCPLQDLKCIRGFFAHYTQCMVAAGPVPDPYVLHLLPNLHIPHANLTFELNNPKIKGLNKWKIMEFYINKATDRLVLEVQFDKIVVTCPEANLKYHRKGKEPLEVSDSTVIEYSDLSFTLTVPHINELQISKGQVYTYNNDVAPKYTLGPAIYSSKDPGFILAISEMQLKLGLTLQEAFVSQGPVFFTAFFKSSICDFIYD